MLTFNAPPFADINISHYKIEKQTTNKLATLLLFSAKYNANRLELLLLFLFEYTNYAAANRVVFVRLFLLLLFYIFICINMFMCIIV